MRLLAGNICIPIDVQIKDLLTKSNFYTNQQTEIDTDRIVE